MSDRYTHVILVFSNCTQAIVRLLQWQGRYHETNKSYFDKIKSDKKDVVYMFDIYLWGKYS